MFVFCLVFLSVCRRPWHGGFLPHCAIPISTPFLVLLAIAWISEGAAAAGGSIHEGKSMVDRYHRKLSSYLSRR
jgi:hypothetical protein